MFCSDLNLRDGFPCKKDKVVDFAFHIDWKLVVVFAKIVINTAFVTRNNTGRLSVWKAINVFLKCSFNFTCDFRKPKRCKDESEK